MFCHRRAGVWSSRRCEVKANDEQSPPLLSSNQTWLQGALIANISRSARIVSVSMSVVLLQSPLLSPSIHQVFSTSGACKRCSLCHCPLTSAKCCRCRGAVGKNAPIDATSFGPKLHRSYAPPPPRCTRSSDIFPVYALSQAINTAASCLVNVLLPKF